MKNRPKVQATPTASASTSPTTAGANVEQPRKNGKVCRSCGRFVIFKHLVRKMVDGKNTYEDWCKVCKHEEQELPSLKGNIRERQLEKLALAKLRRRREVKRCWHKWAARKRKEQAQEVLNATSDELEALLRDAGVDV